MSDSTLLSSTWYYLWHSAIPCQCYSRWFWYPTSPPHFIVKTTEVIGGVPYKPSPNRRERRFFGQVPISMECLSEAPAEDAGQDNEDGGPNHVLVISDCNGRCEFVSLFQHSTHFVFISLVLMLLSCFFFAFFCLSTVSIFCDDHFRSSVRVLTTSSSFRTATGDASM